MPSKASLILPARLAVLSFAVVLVVGTFLLALPGMHMRQQLTLFESFFTTTSALTVTGLEAVSLHEFTGFGQAVLLILIQLGGLGLITLSMIMVALVVDMGLSVQSMASEVLELEHIKDVKRILIFTAALMTACELVAIPFLYAAISQHYAPWVAFKLSIFHSVSAFCNAGLNIFPLGNEVFRTDPLFLLVTGSLILIGGIGFFVWYEIFNRIRAWMLGKSLGRLSLHSKIVLHATFWIIFVASAVYWILEANNSMEGLTAGQQILNALFNGIAMRSAGFLTTAAEHLQRTTLFAILLVSFIGSAPGSTGSGIKVTTLAIIFGLLRGVLKGESEIYLFGRSLYKMQIMRALAIFFLSMLFCLGALFCLLIIEQGWSFFELVLEVFSAYSNLGLSVGITPQLLPASKVFLALLMFVGRVGVINFIQAFTSRGEPAEFQYPEEHILLG